MSTNHPIRRWLPATFLIATIIFVGLYWVGLAASHEMSYLTAHVRMADAFKKALATAPRVLFNDQFTAPQLWFIPFALGMGILYWSLRKDLRRRIIFAALGVLLPNIAINPGVIILALALPSFFAGACDGEDWGEGWFANAAAGA
ncbi:MAG: hypothetical protein JWR19_2907 [Pedosphaera sp.]|jgi:hypothetical protein|nr:hypothetical protein [Pedosphaera sp.]